MYRWGAMQLAKLLCSSTGRHRLLALATLLLVQFMTGMAAAAKKAEPVIGDIDQPMQFAIVRSNNSGCEPICPQWIWASGAIEPGTPAVFKRFLKKVGKLKLPVVLSSPGGDIDAALAMGRMIRERNLDTGVGTAYLTGCPAGERDCFAKQKQAGVYFGVIIANNVYCNSACPLVLAGGVRRFASGWAYVGVHQITTTYTRERIFYREKYKIVRGKKRVTEKKIVGRKTLGSYQSTKLPKATERKVQAYLKEMGIARSYLATAQGTPAADVRKLDQSEMLGMNLVTGDASVGELARGGLCDALPLAGNCVDISGRGGAAEAVSYLPRPATGQTSEPMRFIVVQADKSGCDARCPEWISAEGRVDDKTPALLDETLKSLGGRKLPLVVSSTGGNLDAALRLGRAIRKSGLVVVVGRTDVVDCGSDGRGCASKPAGNARYRGGASSRSAVCTAECTILLASGIQRLAGQFSAIGWKGVPTAEQIETHFKEMGVNPRFLSEGPWELLDERGQWRLFRMNLLTATLGVEAVVEGRECKGQPAPNLCYTPPT
ncbi:hypothetical protein [Aminobacter sp. BE110]|uniref:hypothetical protein n=1 Tax=Aminobacter sp. BE110 TaxID=2817840 RepID=UPI003D1B451A